MKKAIHRIGDVRFVLDGTTVTAQQRCGPVTLGDHSKRYYWHFAGRVGLEALMVAARHGLGTQLRGRRCVALGDRVEWCGVRASDLLVALDEWREAGCPRRVWKRLDWDQKTR